MTISDGKIYLLSYKNEASACIKVSIELMKTQYKKKPKNIKSDRARGYVNEELRSYLIQEGIHIQYTVPYSPQQNGVAERKK